MDKSFTYVINCSCGDSVEAKSDNKEELSNLVNFVKKHQTHNFNVIRTFDNVKRLGE